ncbi:MAG: glycerol-3-phosphate dehydrogenase [Gemmatimonadaceae bacterium]
MLIADASPRDTRRRARAALGEREFDLLIIGGGITGAGTARDAALRGLSVALIERDDFGSGTSSRSSRLVHGGVRYLEHGHLHLVFESSAERRRLLRIAPHLVRPLEFTWPVYQGARIPGWKVAAGLTLYDMLALFQNIGKHRRLTGRAVLAKEPALRSEALMGGASYHDAATDDARLTLVNVLDAVERGAVAANHVEARRLVFAAGSARGAEVTDRLTGASFVVRARVIVNAAGPWGDEVRLLESSVAPSGVRGTKGVHVAVARSRVLNRGAVTLLSPLDGRVMFVLPAGDQTIIGTTETDTRAHPDSVRASAADLDYLLASANAYFPSAALARDDIIAAWAGIRPLAAEQVGAMANAASREHAITRGTAGVLSVSGGKLTTYRAMAEEIVGIVLKTLHRRAPASGSARTLLPGGALDSVEDEAARATASVTGWADQSASVVTRLVHAHGSRWPRVWSRATHEPRLAAALVPGLPYLAVEAIHAVHAEMACTLADILMRRTRIAYETTDHGVAAADRVAALVAGPLAWDTAQQRDAVEEYEREARRVFDVDATG